MIGFARLTRNLVLAMVVVGGWGCASRQQPPQQQQAPTRIELTGTPGARVTGYYILNGKRVDLTARVPATLTPSGLWQVVVMKSDPQDEVGLMVIGPRGSTGLVMPSGRAGGARVQVAGEMSVSLVGDDESLARRDNALFVIAPYWSDGTWVFDDPGAGLKREPFVAGVPEMVDLLVRDVPDAKKGFRLTFAEKPFPGFQRKLQWVRAESGGNRYRLADSSMEGWLCPAMFRYFDHAPRELFVRADAGHR